MERAMHFQGMILYVEDPGRTAVFYHRAFGLAVAFRTPDGSYLELDAGHASTLALATRAFAERGSPGGTRPTAAGAPPAGFNLTLRTKEVAAAFERAVAAGATPVQPPAAKPWGQTTALVRDADGVLVELGTPWSAP